MPRPLYNSTPVYEMSAYRSPRPRWFISRGGGVMVPLIAADELPVNVKLAGVPRTMDLDGAARMEFLGEFTNDGAIYSLEMPIEQVTSPTSTVASLNENSTVAANTEPEPVSPPPTRPQQRYAQSSWPYSNGGKKEYCTYWIRTGDCAYMEKGCLYKHEMPDHATLVRIGFQGVPRWWSHGLHRSRDAGPRSRFGRGGRGGRRPIPSSRSGRYRSGSNSEDLDDDDGGENRSDEGEWNVDARGGDGDDCDAGNGAGNEPDAWAAELPVAEQDSPAEVTGTSAVVNGDAGYNSESHEQASSDRADDCGASAIGDLIDLSSMAAVPPISDSHQQLQSSSHSVQGTDYNSNVPRPASPPAASSKWTTSSFQEVRPSSRTSTNPSSRSRSPRKNGAHTNNIVIPMPPKRSNSRSTNGIQHQHQHQHQHQQHYQHQLQLLEQQRNIALQAKSKSNGNGNSNRDTSNTRDAVTQANPGFEAEAEAGADADADAEEQDPQTEDLGFDCGTVQGDAAAFQWEEGYENEWKPRGRKVPGAMGMSGMGGGGGAAVGLRGSRYAAY